jgi:hypothetical protein
MKRVILNLFFSGLVIILMACNFGNNDNASAKNNRVVISENLVSLTLDKQESYYDNSTGQFCDKGVHDCVLKLTVNHALFANLLSQKVGKIKVKLTPITAKAEQLKLIEFDKKTPTEFNIETLDVKSKDYYQDVYFTIPKNLDLGGTVKFKVEVTAAGRTVAQNYTNIALNVATRKITDIKFDQSIYTKGNIGHVTFTATSTNSDDKFELTATNLIDRDNSGLSNVGGSCMIDMKGQYQASCSIQNAFTVVKYSDENPKPNFIIYAIDHEYHDSDYGSHELGQKHPVTVAPEPAPSLPTLDIKADNLEITRSNPVQLSVGFTQKSPDFTSPISTDIKLTEVLAKRLRHKLTAETDISKYIDIQPQQLTFENKDRQTVTISIKPEVTDEQMKAIFLSFKVSAIAIDATHAADSATVMVHNQAFYNDPKFDMMDKDAKIVTALHFVNGKAAQVFNLKAYKLDKMGGKIEDVNIYVAKLDSKDALDGFVMNKDIDVANNTIKFTIQAIDADINIPARLIAVLNSQEIPINSGTINVDVINAPLSYHILPEVKPVLSDFVEPYYIKIEYVDGAIKSNAVKTLALYADTATDGCANLIVRKIIVPTSGNPIVGQTCDLATQNCSCELNADATVAGYCVFKIEPQNAYTTANQSCVIGVKVDGQDVPASHKVIATNGFDPIEISANANSPSFPDGHKIEMCASDTADYNNCPLNYNNWVTELTKANIDNNTLFNKAALFSISKDFFNPGDVNGNKFILNNYPGRNLGRVPGFENEIAILPKTNFIMGWKNGSPKWDNNRCSTAAFETSNLGCDNRDDSAFSVYGKAYIEPGAIIVSQVEQSSVVTIDASKSKLNIPLRWETMGQAWHQNAKYHAVEAKGGSAIMFNLLDVLPTTL